MRTGHTLSLSLSFAADVLTETFFAALYLPRQFPAQLWLPAPFPKPQPARHFPLCGSSRANTLPEPYVSQGL